MGSTANRLTLALVDLDKNRIKHRLITSIKLYSRQVVLHPNWIYIDSILSELQYSYFDSIASSLRVTDEDKSSENVLFGPPNCFECFPVLYLMEIAFKI